MADRNQYWGHQMAICGTHVHVGVDHRDKALPITNGLARFYPYLLALSCASPFWEGEDSGYASQRTMLFQQLSTNGLPYPMRKWTEFEDYAEELFDSGMISTPSEIRWDVRPSPKFGTVENRTADSVPTFAELGCVAALTQCFAEYVSRSYAHDQTYESLSPWLVRENKWRAARYGMDASVITPNPARRRGAAARGPCAVAGPAGADLPRPRLRGRAGLRRDHRGARGELPAAARGRRAGAGAAAAAGRDRPGFTVRWPSNRVRREALPAAGHP